MVAVLKQASPHREAWHAHLRPYVNFIPVRRDMSDLEAQIVWALSNATRLHAIAQAGAELAMRHLSRRAQLCHWLALLRGLARHTEGPVGVERFATRVVEAPSVLLGAVLHNAITSPLRPQLTHPRRWRNPLRQLAEWLADLRDASGIRLTPCLPGLTRSHLCLDL